MCTRFSGRRGSSSRLIGCAVVAVALVGAAVSPARAQVLYGSIVGNVTDASGAAVPGATVTITDQQRSLTRNEVTDDTGPSTFSTVQTEYYRVRVALTGFQPFERDNVRVTLNSVVRVNATLGVGEVTETVMVVADTPILQTDRAEVRSEISTTELQNLPVPLGRNYQRLFNSPGFTPPGDAHSIASNPRVRRSSTSTAPAAANNTRIDGVTSTWGCRTLRRMPALESIETVNVVTNSFDAEQGSPEALPSTCKSRAARTRSRLRVRVSPQRASAGRQLLRATRDRQRRLSYNQFGGTLGGPFVRNKLFFFASYEHARPPDGQLHRVGADRRAAARRSVRRPHRSTTR